MEASALLSQLPAYVTEFLHRCGVNANEKNTHAAYGRKPKLFLYFYEPSSLLLVFTLTEECGINI
jgi:hypothetical protein